VLVAGVSIAARWWGPTIGGILMGLPWFTGPALFILVQDKGIEFGLAACAGVELGVVCVAAFMLAYGFVSKFAHWPLSLLIALAAFLGSAWTMQQLVALPVSLWSAAGAGALALVASHVLLPRPRMPPALQSLPWWDIPTRMAATGALVTALMLAADALGPQLSGIFATFPVILTVVGTFTHYRWGREAVWRMLRGVTVSLFTFVAFFLVVGLALPAVGLVASYALAALVAVAMTTGVLALNGARG
jgi:hypothetical protein